MARSTSSRVLPVRFWMRPSNSSSFPCTNLKSSSVNWAYFCFSLPLTMFQSPFSTSVFTGFECFVFGSLGYAHLRNQHLPLADTMPALCLVLNVLRFQGLRHCSPSPHSAKALRIANKERRAFAFCKSGSTPGQHCYTLPVAKARNRDRANHNYGLSSCC
jgi:hypothetical protein